MTSIEAYNNFLIKINKNDSNRNIKIPKGQFVFLFNQQAPIWLSDTIESDINSDRINSISELLNLDVPLPKISEKETVSQFMVPSDYFRYSSSYCLAKKSKCGERVIYCWDIKNKNKNTLLQNENEKPSFEYEETFLQHTGNSIAVYKTDFDIKSFYVDYYRLPQKIDLEGYTTIDNLNSTTINPDISDYFVNKIIDYCVLETIRIYQNPDGFPLAKDRLN